MGVNALQTSSPSHFLFPLLSPLLSLFSFPSNPARGVWWSAVSSPSGQCRVQPPNAFWCF